MTKENNFKDKISELINHKNTRKTIRAIEIVASNLKEMIKVHPVVSTVAAVVDSGAKVYEYLNPQYPEADYATMYIDKNKLIPFSKLENMVFVKFMDKLSAHKMFTRPVETTDENKVIYEHVFSNEISLFEKVTRHDANINFFDDGSEALPIVGSYTDTMSSNDASAFYKRNAEDFGIICREIISSNYPQGIRLQGDSNGGDGFLISERHCALEEDYFCTNVEENLFIEELNKAKSLGLQRTYLFHGPPGTGKTKFAEIIANKLGGIKIQMAAIYLDTFASDPSFAELIIALNPTIIILDDFERTNLTPTQLMDFFENIKKRLKDTTVILTANSLKELDPVVIRPGRIDEKILFPFPDIDSRRKLINYFCSVQGIKFNEDEFEKILELTSGLTQAYIREFFNQLKIKNVTNSQNILLEMHRDLENSEFGTDYGYSEIKPNLKDPKVEEVDDDYDEEDDSDDDDQQENLELNMSNPRELRKLRIKKSALNKILRKKSRRIIRN